MLSAHFCTNLNVLRLIEEHPLPVLKIINEDRGNPFPEQNCLRNVLREDTVQCSKVAGPFEVP